MNFSSSLITLGAFLGVASAKKTQFAIVYDLSQGATQQTYFRSAFVQGFEAAVSTLSTDVEYALGSTIDKPIPGIGVGTYGGYPGSEGRPEDHCWKRLQDFTSDYSMVSSALFSAQSLNGLDILQGQIEGVMNALYDPALSWDASDDTERVVVLVTDQWTHSANEGGVLQTAVEDFSFPIRCVPGPNGESATSIGGSTKGGFGAIEPTVGGYSWTDEFDRYERYAALHQIRACVKGGLSADLQKEYDTLRAAHPVRVYPSIQPFNLELLKENSDEHCRFHDYPSYQDVTKGFAERKAKWLVFHGDSQDQFSTSAVWTWAVGSEEWGFAPTPMTIANIADKTAITAAEAKEVLVQAFAALQIA